MIHYGPHQGGVMIYHDRDPVKFYGKVHHLDQLAIECLNGKLTVHVMPEPIHIYDQPWLRRLASVAAGMAAEKEEI